MNNESLTFFYKMRFFEVLFLLNLFVSLLNVQFTNGDDPGDEPKIVTKDGNLAIIAARDKNINFITSKKGGLVANGLNLLTLAKKAYNASVAIERLENTVIADLLSTMARLKKSVEGPDGLEEKMTNFVLLGTLPSGLANTTNFVDKVTFTRRLSKLRSRISALEMWRDLVSQLLTVDDCQVHTPCKNAAKCIDLFNGYLCQCADGWEGKNCDVDINECARFAGTDLGCQNDAKCINRPGGYECNCKPGFVGTHCAHTASDCSSASALELCGHGMCISQRNQYGYSCICDQGWTTDGTHPQCNVDVDECQSNHPPCSLKPEVKCKNLPGSFFCGDCPPGFTGNGYYCHDIDECLTGNGGCSIIPRVKCINTYGSRWCTSCPPGYTGDGVQCSPVSSSNVCGQNNGGCYPLAKCSPNYQLTASVECWCPAGYYGDGYGPSGCKSVANLSDNVCVRHQNVCGSHGICEPNGDLFKCTCKAGFTGKKCDEFDHCLSSPCLNGGTCFNTADGAKCTCPGTFTGNRCENEKESCSGLVTGLTGTLRYPMSNSTAKYPHKTSCAWIIETNATLVLNVTFSKFKLEYGPECQFDWLQIHDGRSTTAHMIGRFCGNTLPKGGNIISTHNVLYFWFHSDNNISHDGFELNWTSIEPYCGDVIEAKTHGNIQSPGSPGNYPPNRDCYWVILAPYGKRLTFQFFSLDVGINEDCRKDFVAIYSGYSELDSLIAKFCNASNPEPIVSPGEQVLVHFHSDDKNSYSGFQMTYTVIEGIPGCGGTYTASSGEISPPLKNGKYLNNVVCEYRIMLPLNNRVKLRFGKFNLEESEKCTKDYVEIFDGGKSTDPTFGKFCGKKLPLPLTSSTNAIFIKFVSNWAISDDGFAISYETLCGGQFTEKDGLITSPGYPGETVGSIKCLYEIQRPLGTSIKITIDEFNIDEIVLESSLNRNRSCSSTFLSVYDGCYTNNATLLGKFCDEVSDSDLILISKYNEVFILVESEIGIIKSFVINYTSIELECGGVMKQRTGLIQHSSGDKLPPLKGIKCHWLIVAPTANIIQLNWIHFDIGNSFNCARDYVAIFDNTSNPSTNLELGTFCGNKLPPVVLSTENILEIVFHHQIPRASSFVGNYVMIDESKICGRQYRSIYGVITSPKYPDFYPKNSECVWTIKVPSGQQIVLVFDDFSIRNNTQCTYDYLEIRNGATAEAPLINKYCGSTIPQYITSTTNEFYLKFKSGMYRNSKGFKLHWDGSSVGCGGTLTAPEGFITSPQYPKSYERRSECFWKINVNPGSLIDVVFVDLDLEPSSSCLMDYVEIFDGLTMQNQIGRYCKTVATRISSIGNSLLIKFRSDDVYEGRGFKLKYTTACNNTLTGFYGAIESPNYPNSIPEHLNCYWTIHVPLGNKINVTFFDFDVQREVTEKGQKKCSLTYLEIKEAENTTDGELVNSNLGRFCGTKTPEFISTNTNMMILNFVTYLFNQRRGFRLEWMRVGCGGVLTSSYGTITTPNYPKGYPINIECEWLIKTDTAIQLTFVDFSLESLNDCAFDSVTVYNGATTKAPVLTTLCHVTKEKMLISGTTNRMLIRFQSDGSFTGHGFKATYLPIKQMCGGTFTLPSGYIYSRNYPMNYEHNDNCFWKIKMPPSYLIRLTFEDFDLENRKNCTFDYVKVYDGDSVLAPVIFNQCGSSLANDTKIVVSSGNVLYVQMRTDNSYAAKGFKAKYEISCGAHLISNSRGIISVHPHIANQLSCNWTIETNVPDQHISFTVTHLHYDLCYGESGSLKIYDGKTHEAPLIGSYCEKAPPTLISSGQSLHIDIDDLSAPFEATYSALSMECGGTLTSLDGQFASVGYPNNYPPNSDCIWVIKPPLGYKVTLQIVDLDLEGSEFCNNDFLEIHAGITVKDKLIGAFCGNNVPLNITVSNGFWLHFKSDAAGTRTGFKAEYSVLRENVLNDTSGRIQSPAFPRYYTKTETYKWKISVKLRHHIVFTVKQFDMLDFSSEDNSCDSSYVSFYDGADDDAPLLSKVCWFNVPTYIETTTNMAFVVFGNEGYQTGSLFDIEYKEVKTETFRSKNKTLDFDICGSNVTYLLNASDVVTVSSPNYPSSYSNNLDCEWSFKTDVYHHPMLTFNDISMERTGTCHADYIRLFDSSKPTRKELGSYCDETSKGVQVETVGPSLTVRLHTDGFVAKRGFNASIKAVCGGDIELYSDGLIDFNITMRKQQKRFNVTCIWRIKAKTGRTVELKFLEYNMTSTAYDCYNNVVIKNGLDSDSPILSPGKFCDADKALKAAMESSGNNLFIKATIQVAGVNTFKLKFQEKSSSCGYDIVLTHELNKVYVIRSPNYPNMPNPHTECIWTVRAPAAESISLNFLDRFDIGYSKSCNQEALEIYDGSTGFAPLLGRFCGRKPGTVKSMANIIRIRYYTDSLEPHNGFKAAVEIATCGGVIRQNAGFITSPNYPIYGSVAKNIECLWRIEVIKGFNVLLQFEELNLPLSQNCRNVPKVEIYDNFPIDNKGNRTFLGVYCSSEQPKTIIRSATDEVIVHYTTLSDRSYRYKGFKLNFTATDSSCSATYTESEGFIATPSYPDMQSRVQFCNWNIQVPGRRITMNFIDLNLDISSYILIYEGRKLGVYVGTLNYTHNQSNKIIKTTSGLVNIYYSAPNANGRRRFKMKWTSDELSLCSGSISLQSGVIASPIMQSSQNQSYYCEWVRDVPALPNETISLNFKNISWLGNVRGCPHSISITTGNGVGNAKCDFSDGDFRVALPTASHIEISARATNNYRNLMFTMTYVVYKCGGVITTLSKLSLPVHDETLLGKTLDCVWVVRFHEGSVTANITRMALSSDDNQYLIIKNGETFRSPTIGKFTGNPIKPIDLIRSQHSKMWIEFHADTFKNETKLEIDLQREVSACGGIYGIPFVTTSPNYPKSYSNNAECLWIVTAPTGYHISIELKDYLQMEQSDNCTKDYLMIMEKDRLDDWVEVDRLCGRDMKTINTTSNQVRVLFRSDNETTGRGFRIQFHFRCGGVFYATKQLQQIVSPRYPLSYPNNIMCNYSIVAPDGGYVNVVFDDFQLNGEGGDCKNDNLTIRWQQYAWSNLYFAHKLYCGSNKPEVQRRVKNIQVLFKAHSVRPKKGFKFGYRIDTCEKDISEPTVISSPTDPVTEKYLTSIDCVWNITAPENQVVVMRFEKFHLESHILCRYDYLDIYDSSSTNNKTRLAHLCGNLNNENLRTIRSTGNKMLVSMHTDASNSQTGFEALIYFTYGESSGCGGEIMLNKSNRKQVIQSPANLARNKTISPTLDCHWIIKSEQMSTIKLKLKSIRLPKCSLARNERNRMTTNKNGTLAGKNNTDLCAECDAITIYDGLSTFSDVYFKHCSGEIAGKVMTTSRNNLLIHFVTESIDSEVGFQAEVEMIESTCGGSLVVNVTDERKTLTSPNYPANYPSNTRCVWLLQTNAFNGFSKIEVEIEDLDLEESIDGLCSSDSLEFDDYSNSKTILEGLGTSFVYRGKKNIPFAVQSFIAGRVPTTKMVYCGQMKKVDYFSPSNAVQILFNSNGDNERKGFKLNFWNTGCNRNYTGAQGRVLNEKLNGSCHVTITAPTNFTISLYFHIFFIQDSRNCEKAGLIIKEKPNNITVELAKVCGYSLPSPVFSTHNFVSIDTYNNATSFGNYDITYTTTDQGPGCGGRFFNYGGIFTSPNYPGSYKKSKYCRWEVTTPAQTVIVLRFNTFDLGSSSTCATNYLQLLNENDDVLTSYCGGDSPASYRASSNKVTVRYVTGVNNQGRGWSLDFMGVSPMLEV